MNKSGDQLELPSSMQMDAVQHVSLHNALAIDPLVSRWALSLPLVAVGDAQHYQGKWTNDYQVYRSQLKYLTQ
jgi:hypothetical protein